MSTIRIVIQVLGWVYTVMWSLTYDFQITLNCRLKNVEGMNLDFVIVGLNGLSAYTIYNTIGFWVSDEDTGHVSASDLAFSIHSLLACIFMYGQTYVYPRGDNKQSWSTIIIFAVTWTFLLIYLLLCHNLIIKPRSEWTFVSLLGYLKLFTTFFKYLPQAIWNCQRQTTKGWSIDLVLLGLGGGSLSALTVILHDCYIPESKFNLTKFVLGLIVAVYNILFSCQHYCLYASSTDKADKDNSLFEDEYLPKQQVRT